MSSFMPRYSALSPYRLMRQETGFPLPIGAGNAMSKSLYCGMKATASWGCDQACASPTGGVFNLEFSPDGSILVAACEKRSIQLFDPLTHQRFCSVNEAHVDCVNCVKFLDRRMFATCSDDCTIALWDVRNLKKKTLELLGHSNWVKNIEFSVKDKLLVSSGLDGSIFTWDINLYTERNTDFKRVFQASGLMRCRLSPDAKQMVMSTTGGLLVIIHDLNLSTLYHDLLGFKPNLYRLMQMANQHMPVAALHDHLFHHSRKQNRVEFVSDFPSGNDAEVVSSLQIHPQGWCALSRNVSHDDKSEWSCIHDIQPYTDSEKSIRDTLPASSTRELRSLRRSTTLRYRSIRNSNDAQPGSSRDGHEMRSSSTSRLQMQERPGTSRAESDSSRLQMQERPGTSRAESDSSRLQMQERPGTSRAESDSSRNTSEAENPEESTTARVVRNMSDVPQSFQVGRMQNDLWVAFMTVRQQRLLQEMANRGQIGRNFNMQRIMGINTGITPRAPTAANKSPSSNGKSISRRCAKQMRLQRKRHELPPDPPEPLYTIRQNRERLLYYVQETNEGKGFIKELCYSADGRIVCSPFGRGMRLLALNENCTELSECITEDFRPTEMVEIGQSLGIHDDLVVSSKFSPRQHLLVTGCLAGKIVWYMPFSGESLY